MFWIKIYGFLSAGIDYFSRGEALIEEIKKGPDSDNKRALLAAEACAFRREK
jgi:hypothetical protein